MKDGLRQIIGKTITEVVISENPNGAPQHQVFIVFSDGTPLEFYGSPFNCASGLDVGGAEEAVRYIEKGGAKTIMVYPDR